VALINDVLPLKAARRYAIANVNRLLGFGTPATSLRWFHLHSLCGTTLFGSHQRYLPPSVWQSLGSVCWPKCATPENEAKCRMYV